MNRAVDYYLAKTFSTPLQEYVRLALTLSDDTDSNRAFEDHQEDHFMKRVMFR
jgi:hypothetical protein